MPETPTTEAAPDAETRGHLIPMPVSATKGRSLTSVVPRPLRANIFQIYSTSRR